MLDHTTELLRLSQIHTELRTLKNGLVRKVSGDRKLGQAVKMNLTAAENFIEATARRLQQPLTEEEFGRDAREALQL